MRVMDPALSEGYETSRRMLRRHDPTYYFATRRLPAELRPATHALYGYVRTADQIVDGPRRAATPDGRRAALDAWEAELEAGAESCQPIVRALADAAARHGLPLGELRTYMRSMRIDCAPGADRHAGRSSWPTWTARPARSAGSWPRCSASRRATTPTSAASALAFQLANFIRDVREDRRLDRIYLPAEDRERFGVSEADLAADAPARRCARCSPTRSSAPAPCSPAPARRSPPRPPPCARACASPSGLYARMLDRVEAIGFDVLGAQPGVRVWHIPGAALRGAAVTRRATLRGAERTPTQRQRADVLICGASFAGLAVARELAGSGADVLVVDRYEIGERATSRLRGADAVAARDGRRARDPAGDPVHGVPHAARLDALPAALELVELRLPDALPGAVRADRRPLRDREGPSAPRRHGPHRPRAT